MYMYMCIIYLISYLYLQSLGLSDIWCQCLQKCLYLLKESQLVLTSSVDEETLKLMLNEREGQMKIKGI